MFQKKLHWKSGISSIFKILKNTISNCFVLKFQTASKAGHVKVSRFFVLYYEKGGKVKSFLQTIF